MKDNSNIENTKHSSNNNKIVIRVIKYIKIRIQDNKILNEQMTFPEINSEKNYVPIVHKYLPP